MMTHARYMAGRRPRTAHAGNRGDWLGTANRRWGEVDSNLD